MDKPWAQTHDFLHFPSHERFDHVLGMSSSSLPYYQNIQAMIGSSVGMDVYGRAYAKRLRGRGMQSLLHARLGRLGSQTSWTVRHTTSETSVQVEESSRDTNPKAMGPEGKDG